MTSLSGLLRQHVRTIVCYGLYVVWGISAISVWAWAASYEFKSEPNGALGADRHWPADTSLTLAADRPTLLFFMHPHCPCTRASLHELERVLVRLGGPQRAQPSCIVVVSVPTGAGPHWRSTDTTQRAAQFPQTNIRYDVGGSEARRFGAFASGTVKLFRSDGELIFAGGITSSRGHEGDNVGSLRLRESLREQVRTSWPATPVFGCQLCIETELSIERHANNSSSRLVDSRAEGAEQ